MVAAFKSITKSNPTEIDQKGQELRANGFTEVSPLAKMQPRQYSRSQAPADPESFDGPLAYTVEWCIDE